MNRVRGVLVAEDGVALVTAIAVLGVISAFVVAVASGAVQVGGKSNRDNDSRRALAAAEAGLQVARYRLTKVNPAAGACFTDRGVAPGTAPAASGECPPASGDVGQNAAFTYYVTPAISVSGTRCGESIVVPSSTFAQRCVTSRGTANGQTRRVQTLVSAGSPVPLFPFAGLLGLDGVDINENGWGDLAGKVGSNGNFRLKSCKTSGSASRVTYDPGPSGTLSNSCSGTIQPATPARTAAWTLDSIADLIGQPNSAKPANNDNDEVFASRTDFQYTYDPAGGERELKDTTDANLIISGPNPRTGSGGIWTFNFCKLTLTHKTTIALQNGAVARFYIDSSERSNSDCGTTGSFTVTNVSYMNYDPAADPPGDANLLQFLVNGSATVAISNQSGFAATLYAPLANVKFTNKTTWYGAIAAKSIEATNGLDFHPGDVSRIVLSNGSGYVRRSWSECRSVPTNTLDPESGC